MRRYRLQLTLLSSPEPFIDTGPDSCRCSVCGSELRRRTISGMAKKHLQSRYHEAKRARP